MTVVASAAVAALALMAMPVPPPSAPTRRFAVVAGSNRGMDDRATLRYAVADAERFAKLVTGMGGVAAEDALILREPTRRAFLDALAGLRDRATAARAAGGRIDVVVYFSGHADDRGLMLGRELLPYRELRSALAAVAADVGITILDACASGAITRLKGGRPHPAFLTDASNTVQGYAFLTSSSENEAAQESERLQGSFFTQALLTGLRGAADVTGDGRVTLGEAYQFAFAETLAQTASTQAGAQHPAYDIKMAGTGDVVLTDVRQISASLTLGRDYEGRFLVLGSRGQLVAELFKPFGRSVELGLEPGTYEVYFEQEQRLLTASVRLQEGQRQELVRNGLRPARRLPTRSRGTGPLPVPALLDGRTRVQVGIGGSRVGVTSTPERDEIHGGAGGVAFAHWLRPDLALGLELAVLDFGSESTPERDHTTGLFAALLGGRYYPPLAGTIRPYLGAALGPFTEVAHTSTPLADDTSTHDTRLGGAVSGGADVFLGRHVSVSLDSRVAFVSHRAPGFGVALSVGWTFGGRP